MSDEQRAARIEELTGYRWPARCLHCGLTTVDPDAYFRPYGWDDQATDEWTRCDASPSGVHEPEPARRLRRATCRCGHPRDMHRHLRDGSDCGRCGSAICPRFRDPRPWWRRLW